MGKKTQFLTPAYTTPYIDFHSDFKEQLFSCGYIADSNANDIENYLFRHNIYYKYLQNGCSMTAHFNVPSNQSIDNCYEEVFVGT